MEWLQFATAFITLSAAVLSLVAVKRAGSIITQQEVGRRATAGRDQSITAKQGE
jgi:hypothetical protein